MEKIQPAAEGFQARNLVNEDGSVAFQLRHRIMPVESKALELSELEEPLKVHDGCSKNTVPLEIEPQLKLGLLIFNHPESGAIIRYQKTYHKSEDGTINDYTLFNYLTGASFTYDANGHLKRVTESNLGGSCTALVCYEKGKITGVQLIDLRGGSHHSIDTFIHYDENLQETRRYAEEKTNLSKPQEGLQMTVTAKNRGQEEKRKDSFIAYT